jgi:hypothetical protein
MPHLVEMDLKLCGRHEELYGVKHGPLSDFRLESEFPPKVGEALGVHRAAIQQQAPEFLQSRLGEERRAPLSPLRISTRPRSIIVWTAGGIFGSFFRGPERQVRRNIPSARRGSSPKWRHIS